MIQDSNNIYFKNIKIEKMQSLSVSGIKIVNSRNNIQFFDCEFTDNKIFGPMSNDYTKPQGSVFYLSESEIYGYNLKFNGNQATSGAGLHIRKQSKVTFKKVEIKNNIAANGGFGYVTEESYIRINSEAGDVISGN